MKKKIVFFYCSGIDDVLLGLPKVAGIQIQMSFWARIFAKQGWDVVSFTANGKQSSFEGIRFIGKEKTGIFSKLHLTIIQEILDFLNCLKSQPDVIISRGASRCLFYLSVMCKWKDIQLIHFGASDTDFIPGKEIVGGSIINRKLYQKSLNHIDFFITQNVKQQVSLWENYRKRSLMLSNIWISSEEQVYEKKYDAIWIANLRPLKRAEWFVKLAKQLPQYQFALIGGPLIKEYYDMINHSASEVNNLLLMGAKSFKEVNHLLAESRLLICTSEFEGFPNTFLQAWAQSIPVVSTVNPSNLLETNHLGCFVENQEELKSQTLSLLSNDNIYDNYVSSIKSYFKENHLADKAYCILFNYLSQ